MQTRRAKTTVELHSGEAMFLGGLVSQRRVGSIKRIPILGHIPLLGAFFTRKDTSLEETELVLIVSPRIIGPASAEVMPPLPWDGQEIQDKDPTD
jgi:pilus assembly protein CpaC